MDAVDRAEGTILGLATGEALGRPTEGAKPGAVKSAFKILRDFQDPEQILPREKIYKWTMPGLYGAGAQQALVLLDSLLQDRGLNVEKYAARLAALSVGAEYHYGVYRGAGRNFRLSVTELKQGRSWQDTGRDSAGNAAAVRAAPAAVFYRHSNAKLADAVIRASLPTHKNPIAISAACAVAFFISSAISMETPEPEMPMDEFLRGVADACRDAENIMADRYGIYLIDDWEKHINFFSGTLLELAARLAEPFDRVCDWISKNAGKVASNTVTRPTLGVAPASVAYAIYLSSIHRGDFESAVTAAVNSGGDAAAVGAMTGAMSGALGGAGRIPDRWLRGLGNRKQLKLRAEALAAGKWLGAKVEDLYDMELGLTDREHSDRLARMKKLGVEFPEKNMGERLSRPEPIKEKFDPKQFKRQKQKLERWMKIAPPQDGWD